jgi:myo-inositol-1(or 4)-monophosphatase
MEFYPLMTYTQAHMSNYTIDYQEVRTVAVRAARAAGQRIREVRSSKGLGIRTKAGQRDLVTRADVEAEGIVLSIIRERFPDHTFLAEESASAVEQCDFGKPLWIIDPVDGTTNFAHNHFQVGVSIAFFHEGEVRVGVVYSPFQEEMFTAIQGQGSYRNEETIRVRETPHLGDALVATGFPYDRSDYVEMRKLSERLHRVLLQCGDIRRLGACSLDISWVACGRLDAFFETVSPWDMAAASLIAKEAGAQMGNFCDLVGSSLPESLRSANLLIATPQIYSSLHALLREDEYSADEVHNPSEEKNE